MARGAAMAHEAMKDLSGDSAPRTFEDLAAEPERTESAAAASPVRVDGPSGRAFVLVDADEFERLRLFEPKALRAADLTDDEIAYMLAQPIPPELARFDDEVPEGGGVAGDAAAVAPHVAWLREPVDDQRAELERKDCELREAATRLHEAGSARAARGGLAQAARRAERGKLLPAPEPQGAAVLVAAPRARRVGHPAARDLMPAITFS